MFRWIFVSLLLSACGIAAVWMLFPQLNQTSFLPSVTGQEAKKEKPAEPAVAPAPALQPVTPAAATGTRTQLEVVVYRNSDPRELSEPIIIPDGTLVIVEKQVVPAEKEGVLTFLGTEVREGEVVPRDKQLPEIQLGFLAVPVGADEKPQEGETFFQFRGDARNTYRRIRETDQFDPGKVVLARLPHKIRKLQVGDRVVRGQLLGLINPQKQLDDVAIKISKLNATETERRAAEKQEAEYQRRVKTQEETNRRTPGAIPRDTLMETQLAYWKFHFEKEKKTAEISSDQRALNASLTDLKFHEIRAAIDGVVKVIYKNHQGEAVKPNEPVLEIQNPSRLRVEGRLEEQEARKLKVGMPVIVEASRPEAPRLVISGHLNTVNCVAVSKGERPVIVSGSDDETLRGWDSLTGDKVWELYGLRSPVRAVACTPPTSKLNLACFGCADGTVRVFDLKNNEQKPREMAERHRGPVLGVAFSPDGAVCATCGDDRSIYLWNIETGASLGRLVNAHSGPVTSVQFASAKRLVSAGKDSRLAVWDVENPKLPRLVGPRFEGRGGEVLTLGVSPDGNTVLFDQGKELRLLTLERQQLVGTLQNPSDGMNFSTMALFSPDGKTILTNGTAPGKLRLWRTPVTQKRGSELRQFVWDSTVTCGTFAPEAVPAGIAAAPEKKVGLAVTGTQDHKVLVWTLPSKEEVEEPVKAQLTLVERVLDTQSRHVRVWAELDSPEWLIPGMHATMVVLPQK